MEDRSHLVCHVCSYQEFSDGCDGFFYCKRCCSRSEEVMDTATADEDMYGIYLSSHRRPRPVIDRSISYAQPPSSFWESLLQQQEEEEPDHHFIPRQRLEYEDYAEEVRARYLMGLQIMIEMQSTALVNNFNASNQILEKATSFWLEFLNTTGVLDDSWAEEAIRESEADKKVDKPKSEADKAKSEADNEQYEADKKTSEENKEESEAEEQGEGKQPRAQYRAEPHNKHGQRAVMTWYRSLSKKVPLSHSLAITFLACHAARESILPTDICKWSLEGKLPYLSAFIEIEKQIGPPSNACPLRSTLMFKPSEAVSSRKLESHAASIALTIGLKLPPVNIHGIALRYLKELSLPAERILPSICRIYEWSSPPDLWLSAKESGFPTRVCVMSLIIVAIRILYNIHGFGIWEKSLQASNDDGIGRTTRHGSLSSGLDRACLGKNTSSHAEISELDTMELLRHLEAARHSKLEPTYDHSKSLYSYLQYCRDVVFAKLGPSFEDFEEQKIDKELWGYYENYKDAGLGDDQGIKYDGGFDHHEKSTKEEVGVLAKGRKRMRDINSMKSRQPSGHNTNHVIGDDLNKTSSSKMINSLKEDMEENRFCYISPRVNVKRLDYLHYVRKKDEGAYIYAVHADYYILLRACAGVAQVDVRAMHSGVLSLERRLQTLLKNKADPARAQNIQKISCKASTCTKML